ncbi:HdeD family acid-resistance protein [Bacteroides sp. KG68]|uniref:HdeD family acid-resistance protein n=1 Tax=unclassified Bacteroides TaxID=2646097 RepID=UPI003D7F9B20
MRGLSYSFLRAICALVIGLILVMFPDRAGDYFVITIGVVLLVPSLITIIGYFVQPAEARPRFPIEGVGSLLFGAWLIIMPDFFTNLLTFLLGFILVMGGVQQIASLSAARRWMSVPRGFYVVPVLILLAGLIALFNPMGVRSTAFIIIGVSSLVYAVSEFLNWFKFMRHRPRKPDTSVKRLTDIEDAEIID